MSEIASTLPILTAIRLLLNGSSPYEVEIKDEEEVWEGADINWVEQFGLRDFYVKLYEIRRR